MCVFVAASVVSGQQPLQQAPGASAVEVSQARGRFTEPSIAINPKNPAQLVVVYQGGAAVQGSASAAYSTDFGRTFSVAEGTKPVDWRVACARQQAAGTPGEYPDPSSGPTQGEVDGSS